MAKREIIGKATVPPKAVQSGPAVRVEYPREGDVLTHPTYSFQVAALPGAKQVEVSIDNGEWRPCRESLGLWWHDWSGYADGYHVLSARTRISSDMSSVSAPRRFSVSKK
jgi:hypothetical protein